MTESHCVYVVTQDPSLVVRASHESLVLLLRADIEPLNINSFESAINYCILLTLCLKNTFIQFDVLYTHSLTIDYHIPLSILCCIVYHVLLINQTVYLGSESHELGDTMSIVFVFEIGSRQLLVEVEEREQRRELALIHFMLVIVHKLSIEVTRVVQF